MKVIEGNIASPLGFSADGLHAGFKKEIRFWMDSIRSPCQCCGCFTTNKVIAAPLILTQSCIENEGQMQAIVVNSGIANSCTGEQGLRDAQTMQQWDANISTQTLQQALSEIVQITFNQITVDGDTSTNDMVIVMSNGCTNNKSFT